MHHLLFNGKFLSAAPTGVHRVAEELIRSCDEILAERSGEAKLLLPRDATRVPPLRTIRPEVIGRSTWQMWEQVDLPRLAGPGMLISLCNLGPVMRRDAITMIHDAQVWDAPASYSPQFRAYYRAMLPRIGHRHRAILTVSEHSRRRLVHHRLAPKEAIHVIPNGVNHVHRSAPDRGAAAARGLVPGRYVLALASAQPHKNIDLLVRAFRDAALSHVTLALVGAGQLASITREASSNVAVLGTVSDAVLFGLMADAGAWACPSVTEGFGLPPLEAMALGTPVIAAPCGALPEVLGDAACWVAPDDPAAWAEAICALIGDTSARNEASARGRRRAAGFTWDRAARQLLNTVADLQTGVTAWAA